MPKIVVIGSVNIDYKFNVEIIAIAGETVVGRKEVQPGGKGANQSVACARIGGDGRFVVDRMRESGVDTGSVSIVTQEQTGCAFIQVDKSGENCIVIDCGTNGSIPNSDIQRFLDEHLEDNDVLLIQNELGIDNLEFMLKLSRHSEFSIIGWLMLEGHLVFNAAPCTPDLKEMDLSGITILIVNQIEATELACSNEKSIDSAIDRIFAKWKIPVVLVTIGSKGSLLYLYGSLSATQDAFKVDVVDTTGAGDTFIGYFLASLIKYGFLFEAEPLARALEIASAASALACSQRGAMDSIPHHSTVTSFLSSYSKE